jgi:uncharacterized RDD family membrane protein YckC
MVATSGFQAKEESVAMSGSSSSIASLSTRITAYLIDSLVLIVFLLIFFVIGGAVLLFSSDMGKEDAPDAAFSAFIAILLGGPLVFWSLFNLALDRWRAQSIGMYVVGIKATSDGSASRSTGNVLLRWFGLSPVLFHPLLIPVWALLSAYATSVTLSRSVLVLTLALVLLCIVSPIVSIASMVLDSERRGIHDRLARTRVVTLDSA